MLCSLLTAVDALVHGVQPVNSDVEECSVTQYTDWVH